jgi:hypothetical protein
MRVIRGQVSRFTKTDVAALSKFRLIWFEDVAHYGGAQHGKRYDWRNLLLNQHSSKGICCLQNSGNNLFRRGLNRFF